MRNLKKCLSVILAVAVLLSSFAVVLADTTATTATTTAASASPAASATPAASAAPGTFSDTVGTKYDTAVTRLTGLGVIEGYKDGTFKPDANITRAEFAAVVVRALGNEDVATASKGVTKFTDVKADHWASGYITIATALNVIKGKGNGIFDPEANITYEQAVTMVVRALGYGPFAEERGGYPAGYMVIASQKEVTKNVGGTIGVASPRGIVAQLLDNSLEVAMLVQKTSADGKVTYEEDTNKTLLVACQNLNKVTGTITAVDTAAGKFTIVITDVADNSEKIDDTTQTFTLKNKDAVPLAEMLNCKVKAYVDDKTFIASTISNDTTIIYDKITKVNEDALYNGVATANSVTLRTSGTKYDLETGANFTVQGDFGDIASPTVAASMNKVAKVFLKDGKVFRIEYFTSAVSGIVKTVNKAYVEYYKVQGANIDTSATATRISSLDTADRVSVIINGKADVLSNLKADMFINAKVSTDAEKVIIVATDKKITGKVMAVGSKDIIVGSLTNIKAFNPDFYFYSVDNGVKYTYKNIFTTTEIALGGGTVSNDPPSDMNNLVGKEVTALCDLDGYIMFVKATSANSEFYGVITKTWAGDAEYVQIFKDVDGTGTKVTYKFADSTKIESGSATQATIAALFTAGVPTTNSNMVYKIKLDADGNMIKATQVTLTAGNVTVVSGKKNFSATAKEVLLNATTSMYLKNDCPMFNLVNASGTFEPSIVKWDSVKGQSVTSTVNMGFALVSGTTTTSEVAVFIAGYNSLGSTDKYYAVVGAKGTWDTNDITLAIQKPDGSIAQVFVSKTQTADNLINFADKGSVITYTKVSDTRVKIANVSSVTYIDNPLAPGTGNIFADLGDLNIDVEAADPESVSGTDNITNKTYTIAPATLTNIDTSNGYITLTGAINVLNSVNAVAATYKVANDCMVYRVSYTAETGAYETYTASSLGDIISTDKVSVYVVDNVVRSILYVHNN